MEPSDAAAPANGAPDDRLVVLDGFGQLTLARHAPHVDAIHIVDAACLIAGDALGLDVKPVSAKVTSVDSQNIALVTVSRRQGTGVSYTGGTAVADAGSGAVLAAAAQALGVEQGVLRAAAARWRDRPGIVEVTVFDGAERTANGTDIHGRLLALVPGPGRLFVTTERFDYRALRLAAASIMVTAELRSGALTEVDRCLATVERCSGR